ncbi:hypothetical protein PM082_016828 [Marasmius tenuissimus]|nr:hypothetical protein PM082_016828 [Marasmius tenuissimus]
MILPRLAIRLSLTLWLVFRGVKGFNILGITPTPFETTPHSGSKANVSWSRDPSLGDPRGFSFAWLSINSAPFRSLGINPVVIESDRLAGDVQLIYPSPGQYNIGIFAQSSGNVT